MENYINIDNVTKKYEDFTAVDNMGLQIAKGTFFGLLGPNGAGKTTLIKMLTGLLKPTGGAIYINGDVMTRDSDHIKRIIGVVPQHVNLDRDLTIRENLIFASKLYGIRGSLRNQKIDQILEFTELKQFENRVAKKLSGGMKRKLMIGKSLINDPEIIFLDEPTVGIDLNSRRKIWDMLKKMKEMGKTVILTTHYIEEAEYLCDRIGLMDKGRIFYNDSSLNLKRKLGEFTVEYFDERSGTTVYKHFDDMDSAKSYAGGLDGNYVLRNTNLEDVFFNFTNRKVL